MTLAKKKEIYLVFLLSFEDTIFVVELSQIYFI